MSRPAWFGVLPFLGRHASPREASPPVQGLVIAGGGARASFQIGALRYLYEHEHIAPQVITATSAGSILGALLAQSRDPADQLSALRDIEKLWLGMSQSSDMFTERSWFTRLKSHADALEVLRQMEESADRQDTEHGSGLWSRFGWGSRQSATRANAASQTETDIDADEPGTSQGNDGLSRTTAPTRDMQASDPGRPDGTVTTPLATQLSPQERTLALAMAEEPGEPLGWTPNVFFQLAAGLPHLGRASADLTAAWRGLENNRSLFKPGPILRRLLSRDFFHSERVTASGVTLRCAFVGLNSGELRYMREDGHIVDRDDQLLPGRAFDISMGVLASCSIPGVFKPVEMNDEWYVDGGIRENVPVEEAVSNLGVTRPYVIVSGPSGLNFDAHVGSGDLISILFRVQSIQSDESERDEVAYARSTGAVVIEPGLSVHDSMHFDPGTLRINRDYGWIRAAEAVHEADGDVQAVNREIIQTRVRAWQRERQMYPGGDHEFDQVMLDELSQLKLRLQTLLKSADMSLLPPGAENWWIHAEGRDEATGPRDSARFPR